MLIAKEGVVDDVGSSEASAGKAQGFDHAGRTRDVIIGLVTVAAGELRQSIVHLSWGVREDELEVLTLPLFQFGAKREGLPRGVNDGEAGVGEKAVGDFVGEGSKWGDADAAGDSNDVLVISAGVKFTKRSVHTDGLATDQFH